jgi:hypothetical protein
MPVSCKSKHGSPTAVAKFISGISRTIISLRDHATGYSYSWMAAISNCSPGQDEYLGWLNSL